MLREPDPAQLMIRKYPTTEAVRQAFATEIAARHESNPSALVAYAAQMRTQMRPDLAAELLARVDTDAQAHPSAAFEHALTLEALGRYQEAIMCNAAFLGVHPNNADAHVLALRLARRAGTTSLLDFGAVRRAINDVAALERYVHQVSWPLLPIAGMLQILAAAARRAPRKLPRLAGRAAIGLAKRILARALVPAAFAFLRLWTGKRHVYITALNRFTRLADLVDRLDPILRRIRARHPEGDTALFVFFFAGYPNRRLYAMYRRECTIVHVRAGIMGRLARLAVELCTLAGRFIEGTVDYRCVNDSFLVHPPAIALTPAETRELAARVEALGINPARRFICFGLRDMAYYQFYGDVMNIPLAQQGKRSDTNHRCPPIDAYARFAAFWAERDCQVVRMGLRVSQSMPSGLPKDVVDYAALGRDDDIDAFLLAKCWFLVAGDTGLFSGAAAFDRPTVVSDLFLIRNTIYSSNKRTRSIFIPKLIEDTRAHRLLTFREMIHFNHAFSFADECEESGFRIIHNTSEDIIEASLELVARLDGSWTEGGDDVDLQRAFHSLYPPSYVGYGSTALVSAHFLRKYSKLLN